jgi:hypothetical protein
MTGTSHNHAAGLIDAVSNRLRGIICVLDLLRQQDGSENQDVLMVLQDAIGDQIDTLENHLKPMVARQSAAA